MIASQCSAVEIVQHKLYQSGDILVAPASRSLVVRGVPQHVRPKTFDLLLYLIERRDRLVRKEELLDSLWKDTAVTEKSLAQCVIELRKIFSDDPRNPRFIKTAAKLGYQFIGPVGDAAPDIVSPGLELEEITTTQVEIEKTSGHWRILAAILAAVCGVLLILWWRSSLRPETVLLAIAGKRPVVVMFFENQSQSADLNWLSAGLADMVITNLSRSGKLTVLSRQQLSSSLERAGKKGPLRLEDAMEVAARSRASAFVLGSFARMGDQVRIAAQVHDARNGRLLAAESVTADRPEQILNRVDTLALELAADLGAPVPGRFQRNGLATLMTSNLEAYRNYSLGVEQAHAYHENEAVELFQKAVSLDPDFAMAQARIGYTLAVTTVQAKEGRLYLEKAFQRSGNLTDSDRMHIAAWYAVANLDYPDAIRRYRELLAIDPADSENYMRLGRLLRGEKRYDESVEVLKQGLALNPDSVDVLNTLGAVYSQLGRHAEAIALEQRYVSLAPLEPNAYDSLALAYAWAGGAAEAEQAYHRALELKPGFDVARRHLAALYCQTGRYRAGLREAQQAIQDAPSGRMRALAHAYVGWLLALTGQLSRAGEEVHAANRLAPMPDIGAVVAARSGQFEQSVALAGKIHKMLWTNRGERPTTWDRTRFYVLGEVAMGENRPQEAIADFQEALRHWPLWSMPALLEDCLGDAYLRLGRLDQAIAEYRRILGIYPVIGMAHYHLGVAYQRNGQPNLAKAEYQRFLELWNQADPDVREVVAARGELERLR